MKSFRKVSYWQVEHCVSKLHLLDGDSCCVSAVCYNQLFAINICFYSCALGLQHFLLVICALILPSSHVGICKEASYHHGEAEDMWACEIPECGVFWPRGCYAWWAVISWYLVVPDTVDNGYNVLRGAPRKQGMAIGFKGTWIRLHSRRVHIFGWLLMRMQHFILHIIRRLGHRKAPCPHTMFIEHEQSLWMMMLHSLHKFASVDTFCEQRCYDVMTVLVEPKY